MVNKEHLIIKMEDQSYLLKEADSFFMSKGINNISSSGSENNLPGFIKLQYPLYFGHYTLVQSDEKVKKPPFVVSFIYKKS